MNADIRETAKSEPRTLAKYIRGKLGVSLTEFARIEQTPVSTLNDRWISPTGKVRIMDAAYRVYVHRFGDL
jgi:DNA-binding transcriptional regulator YiaG